MPIKTLHPIQKKLLSLLKRQLTDPMTIRELQDELELSSPSVVYHHILQLEKKGFLRRNRSNPKDYQILADSPEKKITYLNLYGLARCGHKGSILDGNPIERIPISSKLLGFPSSEAFAVKAKGDSMEPKIKQGDIIIGRKSSSAKNKDIIICINNNETLIKQFKRCENGETLLISINTEKYSPFIASPDFRIEGIVKCIFRNTV